MWPCVVRLDSRSVCYRGNSLIFKTDRMFHWPAAAVRHLLAALHQPINKQQQHLNNTIRLLIGHKLLHVVEPTFTGPFSYPFHCCSGHTGLFYLHIICSISSLLSGRFTPRSQFCIFITNQQSPKIWNLYSWYSGPQPRHSLEDPHENNLDSMLVNIWVSAIKVLDAYFKVIISNTRNMKNLEIIERMQQWRRS